VLLGIKSVGTDPRISPNINARSGNGHLHYLGIAIIMRKPIENT
jgi:hypothetical protein